MRQLGHLVLFTLLLATAPALVASCEVYTVTIQGRTGDHDFELGGLLRWLGRSLTGSDEQKFEFSLSSRRNTGRRHGDISITTHSKMFNMAKPGRTASIRWRDGNVIEMMPTENDLNYIVVGSVPVLIREGAVRLKFVDTMGGTVSGEIDFVGLLRRNEPVHYTATFSGSNPSDDLTEDPCMTNK